MLPETAFVVLGPPHLFFLYVCCLGFWQRFLYIFFWPQSAQGKPTENHHSLMFYTFCMFVAEQTVQFTRAAPEGVCGLPQGHCDLELLGSQFAVTLLGGALAGKHKYFALFGALCGYTGPIRVSFSEICSTLTEYDPKLKKMYILWKGGWS